MPYFIKKFCKGKNEQEQTVRMKTIFIGDWIYNMQVCELLQVLIEATIERCCEK